MVINSNIVRNYSILAFFMVLGMLFFFKFIRKEKNADLLLYLIFGALSAATHYLSIIMFGLFTSSIILINIRNPRWSSLIRISIAGLVIAGVAAYFCSLHGDKIAQYRYVIPTAGEPFQDIEHFLKFFLQSFLLILFLIMNSFSSPYVVFNIFPFVKSIDGITNLLLTLAVSFSFVMCINPREYPADKPTPKSVNLAEKVITVSLWATLLIATIFFIFIADNMFRRFLFFFLLSTLFISRIVSVPKGSTPKQAAVRFSALIIFLAAFSVSALITLPLHESEFDAVITDKSWDEFQNTINEIAASDQKNIIYSDNVLLLTITQGRQNYYEFISNNDVINTISSMPIGNSVLITRYKDQYFQTAELGDAAIPIADTVRTFVQTTPNKFDNIIFVTERTTHVLLTKLIKDCFSRIDGAKVILKRDFKNSFLENPLNKSLYGSYYSEFYIVSIPLESFARSIIDTNGSFCQALK